MIVNIEQLNEMTYYITYKSIMERIISVIANVDEIRCIVDGDTKTMTVKCGTMEAPLLNTLNPLPFANYSYIIKPTMNDLTINKKSIPNCVVCLWNDKMTTCTPIKEHIKYYIKERK